MGEKPFVEQGNISNGPSSFVESVSHNTTEQIPLCVNLDGTLILTHSLPEAVLASLANIGGMGTSSGDGAPERQSLRHRVKTFADVDPKTLPFNAELIDFLRDQKSQGRRLVLATAADRKFAEKIAEHLEIFDEIVTSDGVRNLSGKNKADELVRLYGRRGFDYAGHGESDLPVWREANGIVLVNTPGRVAKPARALAPVIAEINNRSAVLSAAIRAMRPHQWVKNLLVFVPLFTSRSFTDLEGLMGALVIFASFCATASGIYLVNDLLDLSADRSHPRKRNRPLASGRLPLGAGAALAVILVAIGLTLAWSIGQLPIVCLYTAVTLAYSLALKTYPLLDVFVLASLYTLRVVAGGMASGHLASLWLMAFSGFVFLSLALVKRTAEIAAVLAPNGENMETRRGYRSDDLLILQMCGIASSFASSVVLALFVNSTAYSHSFQSPELLWGLVPLTLFWQVRLWLATGRGQMHDDPIVFASKDWVSWLVALAAIAMVVFASLGVGIGPFRIWETHT